MSRPPFFVAIWCPGRVKGGGKRASEHVFGLPGARVTKKAVFEHGNGLEEGARTNGRAGRENDNLGTTKKESDPKAERTRVTFL